MKNTITKKIAMMSRYILPGVFLQCMLITFLIASNINTQLKSMSEIKVKIDASGKLEDVFKEIERISEFKFSYNRTRLDLKQHVSVVSDGESLSDVLLQISKQTNLKFKRINESIHVSKLIQEEERIQEQIDIKQTRNITGRVISQEDGQGLPGANVIERGTSNGTVTDVQGHYSLTVAEGATLVFSSVGYTTMEIAIGTRSIIDLTMTADIHQLEELVVVGYGTQRRVTVTGSVATVDSEFIKNRPLTNSSQAIQGIHGVYVNQAGGGQPGNDVTTIRIRGIGTLNNNNPLVLVDGVEYSLRDINPSDIESISVLKDAASAAIYGSRAANGVIIITTKSGQKEKLRVELNTYTGWQRPTYVPDVVTNSIDYMLARNQASVNEGQPKPYSDAQLEEYRNGTDPDIYPHTDWYDIMISTAPIQDHNLRLSGGTDMTTYSMSIGYLNQEGVVVSTAAKRYSLNSNVRFNLSDKLTLGAIIAGSYWDREEPGNAIGGTGDRDLMGQIARALPIHPNILSDGRWGNTWLTTPGHNIFAHPLATVAESFQFNKSQRGMVNFNADYTLPLDIIYKANFAITKHDVYNHRWMPEIFTFNPKQPDVPLLVRTVPANRSVTRSNNSNLYTTFFHTLGWDKRNIADRHNLNLLFGFSRESFYNSNFNAYIEGFLDNELTELNAGTDGQSVGGSSNESRLMSYFGRANYSYMDKYLLEFTFRYDGSSRFAKGNRWGFFPSVSGGWRINEENFMQDLQFLNNFRLRGSWGQLGNQNVPLYSYLSNININQGTSFNNTLVPGSAITTLSDPNITWETTTITNFGLDLGLWDNKLELNVEVFDKATTGILARINIPAQVGDLTGPVTNLYGMSNRGIEINTSHRNTYGNLNYRVGGNIAFVNNNVDFLDGDVQYTTNTFGNIRVIKEGHPVDSWYLYEALGIFQTQEEVDAHAFQHQNAAPGDIKYRDVNNDGKIDIEDMSVLGRSTPNYTYGFNFDIGYRGFDISAFFQGVQGIDIYPWRNLAFPLYNGAGITKDHLQNSWTPDNPNAKYPRFFLPQRGSRINSQNSTFWLQDASYLRLKNLQLGYTIPTALSSKINMNNIRFYVNAHNLLTFSKYKLTDPEKDILRESIYDYPATKVISIGGNFVF